MPTSVAKWLGVVSSHSIISISLFQCCSLFAIISLITRYDTSKFYPC